MTLKFRLGALAILALLLASCSASHGGGTYGTGLPGDGDSAAAGSAADALDKSALDHTQISGTLVDQNGASIGRATLVIETAFQTQRVETDADGRFEASVLSGENGTVSFALDGKHPSTKVSWTYRGRTPAKIRLVLGTNGKLTVVQ